jgi:hypothetical protein
MLAQHATVDEAVAEFRRKAAPLAAQGDLGGLRALFSRSWAEALATHKEDRWAVKEAMREALRDILVQPSRRVKTGWFDDL